MLLLSIDFFIFILLPCLIAGNEIDLERERSYPTPVRDSPLLPDLVRSLSEQKNSPDVSSTIKEEYDYIIVGAGAAGSVLASRLSEVPCVSVLLLEAGSSPPKLNDVMAYTGNFWFTDLDWQYLTTPQRYTGRGLINRQLFWNSGKGLGGSTLINFGIHVRGNKKDYNDWAAMGAEGWSYEEVLPYFMKLEDNRNFEYAVNEGRRKFTAESSTSQRRRRSRYWDGHTRKRSFTNKSYHGVGGPITVEKPRYNGEIKPPFYQAVTALGYRFVDPNAERQTGFYDLQANLRNSQRCSTAKAYLVPAENRTNLDILPRAFVKKVIIENGHAIGVIFDYYGITYQIRANREVILSAGAMRTPQLLMLSGVGPEEQLRKFNIPVHANLPVGRNMQDHVGIGLNFVLKPFIENFSEKVADERYIKEYIHSRTGPLASTEGEQYEAFLFNDEIDPQIDFPNYQLFPSESSPEIAQVYSNLKPEVYEQVYRPYENSSIMTCFTHILHPRSRGIILLQSTNPYDHPIIDPNYLSDPRDVEDILEGMKTCNRICNRPEMKQVISEPFQTLYPGCEEYSNNEDAYFRCALESVLMTYTHYCCTAKMGDVEDATTVVDSQLRVKYIKNLRVVDASIMPKITSGNTGIPVIMIGEKAADLIKETIQCY